MRAFGVPGVCKFSVVLDLLYFGWLGAERKQKIMNCWKISRDLPQILLNIFP